mgnify:CR=1 FL=1
MKRVLFFLGLFLFVAGGMSQAQSVLDAEDDQDFTNFYTKSLTKEKRAMPYQALREDDVVWQHWVWRTIDFREKFNQFFYYPVYKVDEEVKSNQQGRASLTRVLMEAFKEGLIECYVDDDMQIPVDYESMISKINTETITHIAEFDEYGDEMEGRDTIIRNEFQPENVFSCKLKEAWYIDKQDTRQKVRIVGLSLVYNFCKDRGDELECMPVDLFWVPMNDMRVRNVLVVNNRYDERNDRADMTYDDVFVTRLFDSFVTRETNTYNRPISAYLTGTDAILESQRIEDELFNLESDMWEY